MTNTLSGNTVPVATYFTNRMVATAKSVQTANLEAWPHTTSAHRFDRQCCMLQIYSGPRRIGGFVCQDTKKNNNLLHAHMHACRLPPQDTMLGENRLPSRSPFRISASLIKLQLVYNPSHVRCQVSTTTFQQIGNGTPLPRPECVSNRGTGQPH